MAQDDHRCPTCGTPDDIAAEARSLGRRARFSLFSSAVCLIMAGLNLAFVIGDVLPI